MKYIFDNDLHIHSKISLCSNDPLQTNERILQYAVDNNLKTICLTDHFWDEDVPYTAIEFYQEQNWSHVTAAKPLPQAKGIRFLFGCETELTKNLTLGISKKRIDELDFVIIPTTHFHMTDFTISADIKTPEQKALCWLERFNAVLDMDLPFHKIGIAHLTCGLIDSSRENFLYTIDALKKDELEAVFKKAAQKGVGIELNGDDMKFADEEAETVLRPYKIARETGCKFYCGSDAHHPNVFENAKNVFERAIDLLELTEADKFLI